MHIYSATDVGIGRANNEDRYAVIDNNTCLVADGMGGYAAGEVASKMMADIAEKVLHDLPEIDEKVLAGVVKQANTEIIAASEKIPEYKGMGTTVVIFHAQNNTGYWANVGDSRCYLLRKGMFKQLTKDHSLVAELIENGSITKEEAENNPNRHVLTRAVGVEKRLKVDKGRLKLLENDKFVLCSDGITNVLTDDMIKNILETDGDRNYAERMVKEALHAGSRDNITAVVMVNNTDKERSEG